MEPYLYSAVVRRIIDADTLEVVVDVGFHMTATLPLRLAHVDAPEHNTREGKAATEATAAFLGPLPSLVLVKTYKPADKYGRYLAEVWRNAASLADVLLVKGLAVPYEGGKKQ